MNWTAVLHTLFAALVLGGFLAGSGTLRIVLFAASGLAFVAGLAVARRDDEEPDAGAAADS